MNKVKKIIIVLLFCASSPVFAKGLYEITFINTTDYELTYGVDLFGDVETKAAKKLLGGGDKKGRIKSLDQKTGKPAVTTMTTSYLINKVVIKTADGKQKATYKIPRKAGHDLSGKDWVFTIIDDGGVLKVCRKWAHTNVQDKATIGAEVFAIIVGVLALAEVAASVAAADSAAAAAAAALAESGVVATQPITLITQTGGAAAVAQNVVTLNSAQAAAISAAEGIELSAGMQIGNTAGGYAIISQGGTGYVATAASQSLIGGIYESILATGLASGSAEAAAAIASAITAGQAVVAGLTVASAAVVGALEIASRETESAVTSAWEKTKKAFSKAFGLSRKLHKAGCGEFKKVKAKKKK